MVLLDAANIACKKTRGKDKSLEWHFLRVEHVRKTCQGEWPGAHVLAIIDASAENRLADRHRASAAHADGWLETAPGEADDILLEKAARLGALVVSRDTFKDARRNHPWLEDRDRVWNFSFQKNRSIKLSPASLRPISDEEASKARREKERKAGLVSVAQDEVWVCTAKVGTCTHAGHETTVIQAGALRVCRFCSRPAREQLYAPAIPNLVPTLVLFVDGREQARFPVPPDGLVLGRGGPSRPDVTDVVAALDATAAGRISRRHLRVDLDDDDWPVAIHQGPGGVTFLNPHVGPAGVPLDNRLPEGEPYPLQEGDTLWLDEGRVRLIMTLEGPA
jgi:hypothetical protein